MKRTPFPRSTSADMVIFVENRMLTCNAFKTEFLTCE